MTREAARRRVLVVDDNVDLATATALVLQLCGHVAVMAFTGRDAVEKARSFLPDLVILDLGLPDQSGYDVARALREDVGLRRAVIVMISAHEIEQDHPADGPCLVDRRLIKPVNILKLLRSLDPSSPSEPD
ncbi:MAG: response regulator [Isosphaeraceae bacterium]